MSTDGCLRLAALNVQGGGVAWNGGWCIATGEARGQADLSRAPIPPAKG